MTKRALISLSDKTNVVEFATQLIELGYEIVSSGGTAKHLKENNIQVIKVSDVTEFPEIMNGRVKTLHPKIHGGILANRNVEQHLQQAKELGINLIDIVAVNLYPFKQTVANPESTNEQIIENIDIGGPTLIRSSAKNFQSVLIVTDYEDYQEVIDRIKNNDVSPEFRSSLAQKAFSHTADYDAAISNYFMKFNGNKETLNVALPLKDTLRYGENPHQSASFYQDEEFFEILHGKKLSYNNLIDVDSALKTIYKFNELPTVAIFKHTNPCGIGSDEVLSLAYDKAFATDTLSPFGGIVVVNKPLDMETAKKINKVFTEIILAPKYEEGVLAFLQKKKNRRLLSFDISKLSSLKQHKVITTCVNGYLVQDADINTDLPENWKIVTDRQPSESELQALRFGWNAVASLKSNAVAFTTNDRTIGLGIGQTSRIDSTEIAIMKSKKFNLELNGTICASDGFFPFRDSIDELVKHGVTAVIQPGGSKGDPEVTKACNEHNIAMIMTSMRHFRH